MKMILRLLGVVALLASVIPSTVHAQTDVVLSLDVSTDGLNPGIGYDYLGFRCARPSVP